MIATPLYINDPIKGNVQVGTINPGTLVFYKKVTRSRHYFRLVSGYALQKEAFEKLERIGCTKIIIVETDTGKNLEASMDDWREHGGIWTGRNGKQRTLSEKYMKSAA